ncbi:GNAT family N-acetyltransferase [Salegentibacter flavus]|uniref:Spermine/spermidine N-acetyltransferase n=1 Tax=Salegentibacter flavus TaxID=287099 RepID=A0A1I5BZT0_9FLAO|nr:GNAT family N-acetyltransferase [Salegentibacter flavus]SFN80137.1 spermine/spermidine N-acetyltransferase [Salegentibacter flavus]
MKNIRIEKLGIEGLEPLQKIGKQTFEDAFGSQNTKDNMERYLESNFSKEKIRTELLDKNSEFYFAKMDQQILGYLKVNYGDSQTEFQDENALEIERIYVIQEFLGKKIGQMLYDKAIEIAKKRNSDYIWLGVWEENSRAIRFYGKNGFIKFDKHIFNLGGDAQTDILMKKELN